MRHDATDLQERALT